MRCRRSRNWVLGLVFWLYADGIGIGLGEFLVYADGIGFGGGGFLGGAAYLPQMKKTLDWRFACSSLTMYGVEYAWTHEIRCFVLFFFPVTNGEVDGSM